MDYWTVGQWTPELIATAVAALEREFPHASRYEIVCAVVTTANAQSAAVGADALVRRARLAIQPQYGQSKRFDGGYPWPGG